MDGLEEARELDNFMATQHTKSPVTSLEDVRQWSIYFNGVRASLHLLEALVKYEEEELKNVSPPGS